MWQLTYIVNSQTTEAQLNYGHNIGRHDGKKGVDNVKARGLGFPTCHHVLIAL